MKKIKDLTIEDFPGVNQIEFGKWKKAAVEQNKYMRTNSIIVCLAMIVYLIFQTRLPDYIPIILLILFLIIGLGFLYPRRFRIDKERRKLGIDDDLLKSVIKQKNKESVIK
jgi:hypothetical protein